MSQPSCPRGLLVVLSGPSGVGKDAIFEAARLKLASAVGPSVRSVSVTTRAPRPGEVDGVHYHFCDRVEFERKIAAGAFLEWAKYLDNYYGTPADSVEEKLAAGCHVLLEIEVNGAMQVRDRKPEAIMIYVLPASWKELRTRLENRRTEAPSLRSQRIEVGRQELDYLPHYHYVITNQDGELEKAAGQLCAILIAETCRTSRAAPLLVETTDG